MTIKAEYLFIYEDGTWQTQRNIPLVLPIGVNPLSSEAWEAATEAGTNIAVDFGGKGCLTAYPWCVPQEEEI